MDTLRTTRIDHPVSARRRGTTASPAALPAPDRAHATCAWCRADFATIGQLFDHIDGGHLRLPALAA